jgi:alpha-glucosidase
MAMLLLMALRGNVFVYQGEELGLPQAEVPFDRLVDPEAIANWPETLGRDGARTPFPWRAEAPNAGFSTAEPWLPVDPRHPPLAVDRQDADPASMLNLTRRLIALRRREPALRLGTLRILDVPAPLLAFERRHGEETLTCLFNLGHETVTRPSPGAADVLACVNFDSAPAGDLPPLSGLLTRRPSI